MRGAGSSEVHGRGCGTLFFAFFLLLGCLFTALMLREVFRTALTYGWTETECEILASGGSVDPNADSDEPPYAFAVSYRYEWQGQHFTSEHFGLDRPSYDDWAKIRSLEERYPVGSRTGCFVNPDNPAEAILELRSFWIVFLLPLPLLFVFIGGGGIYLTWFHEERARKGIESISAKASRPGKRWLVPVLFAVLFGIGAGVFFGFLLRPAWQFAHAGEWQPVPCRIEFSRVGVHESDDSTTYSVDVLFSYEVNGVRYRSSRFRFMQSASSGYASKRDTVRQYPRGAETNCYVSPDDPEQAVLDRTFPPAMLLGLIPFVFMLIGAGGLQHQWRNYRSTVPGVGVVLPADSTGTVILRAKPGRWGKLVGAAVFTCIWNGILAPFLWQVGEGWQRGSFEVLLAIFLVPFVLVGLASIGATFYFFLGLFNPSVVLELSRGTIRPGESAQLACTLAGKLSALQRLEIRLEGREEIRYQKGKNTRTEKHVFEQTELLNRQGPFNAFPGSARLKISPEAMHTHEGEHNKVLWHVQVKGDVHLWPDINLEFPIRVLSKQMAERQPAHDSLIAEPEPGAPLRITLRRTTYRPGEMVDGTVEWQLASAPRNLELRLFWYSSGEGTTDVEVVATEPIENPGPFGHRTFRLTLPEVPRSYNGTLFSIRWALELVAVPGEETARVELQVG